jgi:DNA-binding response OmpR family regulator
MAPRYRQVFANDIEIELTSEQLYNHVWGNERAESAEAVIKSAIGRLRKKIDRIYSEGSLIENVWGVGYRMPVKFGQYPY